MTLPEGGPGARTAAARMAAQAAHAAGYLPITEEAEAKFSVPPAQEVGAAMPFQVWYWDEEGAFVGETMFTNPKDAELSGGEPRLIVSLSNFESLAQAYVQAVDRQSTKSCQLEECQERLKKQNLGYYKELNDLHDKNRMLSLCLEHQKAPSGDEAERRRMEDFAACVRDTEVHYFDIIDYLEPEMKEILKDCVKQFNRDLMKENYDLRDKLALYEGRADSKVDLVERMIVLLLGQGTNPAKILRKLWDLTTDKEQTEELRTEMFRLLGIPPGDMEEFQNMIEAMQKKRGEEDKNGRSGGGANGGRGRGRGKGNDADEDGDLTPGGTRKPGKGANDKDFAAQQKHLDDMTAENERLRNEMKRLQREASLAAKRMQELEASEKQATAAFDKNNQEAIKRMTTLEQDQALRKTLEDVSEPDMEETLDRERKKNQSSQDEVRRLNKINSDLEKRLWEAERQLAKMTGLTPEQARAMLGGDAAGGGAGAKDRRSGGGGDGCDGSGSGQTPTGSMAGGLGGRGGSQVRSPRTMSRDGRSTGGGGGSGPGRDGFDRGADMTNIDRSGDYSATTGKPVAMVEAELTQERKMRLQLEHRSRELADEVKTLSDIKSKLEAECADKSEALEDTTVRLQTLIDQDDSDGIHDVQIFCKWLIKKYGSLDQGFKAMDADRSGALSFAEFVATLNTLGWLKVVGRRLFQLFDPRSTGEITLDQLMATFERYSNELGMNAEGLFNSLGIGRGRSDSDDIEGEDTKGELKKSQAKVKELETGNEILRSEIAKQKKAAMVRAVVDGGKTKDASKMQGLERKVDAIKKGHEDLKQERDQLASKVTAAMWKCREANLNVLKYQRENEVTKESYNKLERKFEHFKKSWRQHSKGDEGSGTETMPLRGNYGSRRGSVLAEEVVFAQEVTESVTSMTGTVQVQATSEGESGSDGGGSPLSRPSSRGTRNGFRCPKCQAFLRLVTGESQTVVRTVSRERGSFSKRMSMGHLVPPGVAENELEEGGDKLGEGLGKSVTSSTGSGLTGLSDLAKSFPFASEENAAKSPRQIEMEEAERRIRDMTDDELLAGDPTIASSQDAGGHAPPDHGDMPYRLRMAAAQVGRKLDRFTMLFMDSEDRRKHKKEPGAGAADDDQPESLAPRAWNQHLTNANHQQLMAQAEKNKALWREACDVGHLPFSEKVLKGAVVKQFGSVAVRSSGAGSMRHTERAWSRRPRPPKIRRRRPPTHGRIATPFNATPHCLSLIRSFRPGQTRRAPLSSTW